MEVLSTITQPLSNGGSYVNPKLKDKILIGKNCFSNENEFNEYIKVFKTQSFYHSLQW